MRSKNKLEKDAITINNIKLCDDMILLETQKEIIYKWRTNIITTNSNKRW